MPLAALPPVDDLQTTVLRIPTEAPESDGTATWDATTMLVVEVRAGDETGLGYSYGSPAAAAVVHEHLASVVRDRPVDERPATWLAMYGALRNAGAPGIGATAISAVDIALWDLHARLLDRPLGDLLGRARDAVPVYGSGGFTSMDDDELRDQVAGWAEAGMAAVKVKVGRRPDDDPRRVALVRDAVGPDVRLMVDANGALEVSGALALAEALDGCGVRWFEEPVSSDHVHDLRLLRERVPPGMEVAAGEYGWSPWAYDALIGEQAVDALQADVTRCGGITGFLQVTARAEQAHLPVSAHCAPQASLAVAAAAPAVRDLEWFADHARLEPMVFDGAVLPSGSALPVPGDRPGHGLALRRPDIDRWRA
ncbi:MAG: enolase C-terminal domain-like protein [Acidimicrobiales bacterium]